MCAVFVLRYRNHDVRRLPQVFLSAVVCHVFAQVVKSKMFMAALDKTAKNGRLSRVVIDEAHCCSQVSDSTDVSEKRT